MFTLDPYLILPGHTKTVKKILWLSENIILTGGEDGSIKTWDISNNEGKLIANRDFDEPVTDLSISGDILTVCSGKTVYFFKGEINSNPFKQFTLPTKLNSAHLNIELQVFVVGDMVFT